MGTVVVLGSLMTDLVAQAPRLPYPGESLIGDEFSTFLGGKGSNQAVAAARLGANVIMIGRVGNDSFGDAFFPALEHEGIESKYITRDATTGTGVSLLIIATESGQNVIVAMPRANLNVTAEDVGTALHAIKQQRRQSERREIFLAQCETSMVALRTGLQIARTMGMITILNAAPMPRELLDNSLLALVDMLVVNEVEAALLAQMPVNSIETAKVAAEVLLLRGLTHVIITLGAQGYLWSTREKVIQSVRHYVAPAFIVKAIDVTAAGDAFCGALAASLADDMPMEQALQRANAAGAVTVTRMGALVALPTLTEIEALLKQTNK